MPRLWLSNFLDASKKTPPRAFVVNCTKDLPMISDYGVRIPIDDDHSQAAMLGLVQSLPSIVQSIDSVLKSGGQVVVHCWAGQQRSAATVAAYMMHRGLDLQSAIEHVKTYKPDVFHPSINFLPALKMFAGRRCT